MARLTAALVAALLTLTGCATTPPGTVARPEPTSTVLVIATKPARAPGYDRSCSPGAGCVFGPAWSDDVTVDGGHNGCDTRNDVLRRDLTDVTVDPKTRGCVVVSGTLTDPYSGVAVLYNKANASMVAVDHVIPLSAAWDRGAAGWDLQRRVDFANDPLNLVATTLSMNSSKGDSMPADWMPRINQCWYGQRVIAVAVKYQLPLTVADLNQTHHCRP